MARQIDPELNLWNTVKPSLEEWFDEKLGLINLFSKAKEKIPEYLDTLPDLLNSFQEGFNCRDYDKERSKIILIQRKLNRKLNWLIFIGF